MPTSSLLDRCKDEDNDERKHDAPNSTHAAPPPDDDEMGNKELSFVESTATDSPIVDPRSSFIIELCQRAQAQQSYNLNGGGVPIQNIKMEKLNEEL